MKRKENHNLPYHPEKEISQHILNRKADAKLNYVVKTFEAAMDKRWAGATQGFLAKKISLQELRFLKVLELKYEIENRFFAMSFDLQYRAEVETEGEDTPMEDCSFGVKLKGAVTITDAEFTDQGSGCSEEEKKEYLQRLNNRLILDRIVALDLTKISAVYRANTATWTVSCRSLIGSVTWNLIPPVMHLITPRREECVKLIEFFELVFDAVVRKP